MKYEASRYREEAALCRRLAEAMQSSLLRNHYLGWAEEYERLAAQCDAQAAAASVGIFRKKTSAGDARS